MAFSLYSTANTAQLLAATNVISGCSFATNTLSLNFGSLYLGTNTIGTTRSVAVSDTGATPSNIFVSASNWDSPTGNSFGVSNTIYNSILQPYFVPPALSFTITDSLIKVNTISANRITFGLALPITAKPDVYSQSINIISIC